MKKICYIALLLVFFLCLVLCPEILVQGTCSGLTLWYQRIVPALLPFSILSACTIASGIADSCPVLCTILCGNLFGFPMGSKFCADFAARGTMKRQDATLLSGFTNQLSPAFLYGYAIPEVLGTHVNPALVIVNIYLPSLLCCIGYILSQHQHRHLLLQESHKKTASRFEMNMQIIDAGIISGSTTLIKLCGYIVLFSIGVCILNHIPILSPNVRTCCIGLLEVTNGIYALGHTSVSLSIKYIAMIGIISFGGLCGFAQTISMIQSAGLSSMKYAAAKCVITLLNIVLGLPIIHWFLRY